MLLSAAGWVYLHGGLDRLLSHLPGGSGTAKAGAPSDKASNRQRNHPLNDGLSPEFNPHTRPKPAAAQTQAPDAQTSAKPVSGLQPPFGISEDVFESGAKLYTAHCASCHGVPGQDAALAGSLSPAPSQLWRRHGAQIGVSGRPPGQTYLAIRNGSPHTGMPAYRQTLSDTQIWQLALLLANADQPMPDPVRALLGHRAFQHAE